MVCGLWTTLNAQTYIVCKGDSLYLTISAYRGNLQWQSSPDSLTWSDIPGATFQPYLIIVGTTAKFYRAKITEGTCAPIYSAHKKTILGAGPTGVLASAGPSPLCEGSTLILTGTALNATYWNWSGPNGFSSKLQNPTIPNVTDAETGIYYLTASNDCGGAQATALAIVNPQPQGSLTANGLFCSGGEGLLKWTATSGTGPFTVVYNDGTADRTQTNVTSGVAFPTFINPVTQTTTYKLVSVQDAICTRTSGFTIDTATIIVNGVYSNNQTFNFTGSSQTWSVPAGIISICITVNGAEGGIELNDYQNMPAPPGKGGQVTGILAVTPGQTLTLYVGGQGGTSNGCNSAPGGSNGGYSGGGGAGGYWNGGCAYNSGGGGGMSAIFDAANPIVVAGGGAGGNNQTAGGDGGGGLHLDGLNGQGFAGGFGGTSSSGGTGGCPSWDGDNCTPAVYSTDGTQWTGGNGNIQPACSGGSGGGAGYYGGGGGGASVACKQNKQSNGGGGGGSAYVNTSLVTNIGGYEGVNSGNGSVIIAW